MRPVTVSRAVICALALLGVLTSRSGAAQAQVATDRSITIHYNSGWLREVTLKDGKLTYLWATPKPGREASKAPQDYDRHEFTKRLSDDELAQFGKWIDKYRIFSLTRTLEKEGEAFPAAGPGARLVVSRGDEHFERDLASRETPKEVHWAVKALAGLCWIIKDAAAREQEQAQFEVLRIKSGDFERLEVVQTVPSSWRTGGNMTARALAQLLLVKETAATILRMALCWDEAEAIRAADFSRQSSAMPFREGLWPEVGREKIGDACWHAGDEERSRLLVQSRNLCLVIDATTLDPVFGAPKQSSVDLALLVIEKQFEQHAAEVRRKDYRDVLLTEADLDGLKVRRVYPRVYRGWKGSSSSRWDIQGFQANITFAGADGTIEYVLFDGPADAEAAAIRAMKVGPYPCRKGLWKGAEREPPGDACWCMVTDAEEREPLGLVVRTGKLCIRVWSRAETTTERRRVLLLLADTIVKKWKTAGDAATATNDKDINAFLARLAKRWPEDWHVETRTDGKVAPLYWPEGKGTYLQLCGKGAKDLAKAGREGGELRLWIMEPAYAATGVVPTGNPQQVPSPTEIESLGRRRVFAWGSTLWSAGVPGTAWPTVRDDLRVAMNEAPEPPWGEADVEYYRKRHASYRNQIMEAVKARDKEWLLRDTQRFNDSVGRELLVALVVNMADPAHPEVLFYKAFAPSLAVKIHYAYSDKVHVTRLKDAVQVESNVNPDGTWPDGLRIMLLFRLPPRLRLSIEAAGKEYTAGTPILVRITLHNADPEPYVLTPPLPEGAPPAPMRGFGWGAGLYIKSAGEGEDFKELPRDAPHGDTEIGPVYMPVYRFEGRLEPGQSQSVLQFIRKPVFPAGVRRFQAVLYLRGRKIEAPEVAVEIREAAEREPATFTDEEGRTINGNVASLHNYCYGNRRLERDRPKIVPVVRKTLGTDDQTLDCEYALYMGVLQAIETQDATPDDMALGKEAGEALLRRFPDSWLAGPVRDALANFAAKVKYTAWSEAVEGVQVRLCPDRLQWKASETPTFTLDVRNQGRRNLSFGLGRESLELELDGVWHGVAALRVAGSSAFYVKPGGEHRGARMSLGEDWSWRTKDRDKTLMLSPGKHTVRVAFIARSADRDGGKPVRVISNPVEIEIVAAATDADAHEASLLRVPEGVEPKSACMDRMRKLGLALIAYAHDHEGKFPDSWGELLKKGYLVYPAALICPASGNTVPDDFPKDPKKADVAALKRADEFSDYVLIAGMSQAKGANLTLAHEKRPFVDGGRCCLFVDGHVEWLAEAEFQKRMEA